MGCSLFRYQMLDMVTNAGETAPSQNPRRNRTAAKPAYVVGAAKHMHTMPQITLNNQLCTSSSGLTYIVIPTNLASGNLLIK